MSEYEKPSETSINGLAEAYDIEGDCGFFKATEKLKAATIKQFCSDLHLDYFAGTVRIESQLDEPIVQVKLTDFLTQIVDEVSDDWARKDEPEEFNLIVNGTIDDLQNAIDKLRKSLK